LPYDANLTEFVKLVRKTFGSTLIECEFLSREAYQAVCDSPEQAQSGVSLPFPRDVDSNVAFIKWEGTNDDLAFDKKSEEMITAFFEALGLEDSPIVSSADTDNIRHRVSDAVAKSGGKLIAFDISAKIDDIQDLRSQVRAAIIDFDSRLTIGDFGHLGDGGFHMNVVVPTDLVEEYAERQYELRAVVYEIVTGLGGSISAEHGRGETNRPYIERYCDPATEILFAAIKNVADPHKILGHSGSQPIPQL
jgi:FAD/FMN-containing dehydrogenase